MSCTSHPTTTPTPEGENNREIELKFTVHGREGMSGHMDLTTLESRIIGALSGWVHTPRFQQRDTYWETGGYRVRRREVGTTEEWVEKTSDKGGIIDRYEATLNYTDTLVVLCEHPKGSLVKAISTWDDPSTRVQVAAYVVESHDRYTLYLEVEGPNLPDLQDVAFHVAMVAVVNLVPETRDNFAHYISTGVPDV